MLVPRHCAQAALSLIYSTAEHCAPAWCCSVHTHLIDRVLNDALRIVTGCLRPTPMNNRPVLLGIQSTELCRQGATLSLAKRSCLDPAHILHGQPTEPHAVSKEKLKSRYSCAPVAQKLLHNLSELGICVAQWTNLTWNTSLQEYVSARCLHSYGQHKTYWYEFDQNSLGQTQSPEYWHWAFRFVHAQMGSRFFSEMQVWR